MIGTADASGSLVSVIEYDAFGNELDGAPLPGVTHRDFQLHGMRKDPEHALLPAGWRAPMKAAG